MVSIILTFLHTEMHKTYENAFFPLMWKNKSKVFIFCSIPVCIDFRLINLPRVFFSIADITRLSQCHIPIDSLERLIAEGTFYIKMVLKSQKFHKCH